MRVGNRITLAHASERERTAVTCALSVAAERYREHALEAAFAWAFEGARWGPPMAEQFHRQAADADRIREALED